MKTILLLLNILFLISCSKTIETNTSLVNKNDLLEDIQELTINQVQIIPSTENPFETNINSGTIALKFEIKNTSNNIGKIKINLDYYSYLSYNNSISSCFNYTYSKINANSSCFFIVNLDSNNLTSGIYPYSFSILDKDNGNIATSQYFINIVDPSANTNTPGNPCKANYHPELRTCLPNIKSCSASELSNLSATAGTKNWVSGSTYSSCKLTQCVSNYILDSVANTCSAPIIAQTRACLSQPANSHDGVETSLDNGNTWSICENYTCNANYNNQNGICVAQACNLTNYYQLSNIVQSPLITGISGSYPSCQITTCSSGYIVSNNSCIPDIKNITVNITGQGTVSGTFGDSSTLNCVGPTVPNDCFYTKNTTLNLDLIATPASGYAFNSWGDDCSYSLTTTCSLSVAIDKIISVSFIKQLNIVSPANVFSLSGGGLASIVKKVIFQPDGKLLIGGYFTAYNGITANRIIRLNSDGTVDKTFSSGTGFDGPVHSMYLQSDNKIIVGGSFTSYNGTAKKMLIRLNSDGTVDTTYNTANTFSLGPNNVVVNDLDLMPNGKIIAVGRFASYNGSVGKYVTINDDGTHTFNNYVCNTQGFTSTNSSTLNGEIYSVAAQSDGSVIFGGSFSYFGYSPIASNLARLNSSGCLDTTFNASLGTGFDNIVRDIKIQGSKILIAGEFSTLNSSAQTGIARLNSNGTLDSSFISPAGSVYDILIKPDGKLLISGSFTTYSGTSRKGFAQTDANGVLDTTTYQSATNFTGLVLYYSITSANPGEGYSIAMNAAGNVVVGGYFGNGNLIHYNTDTTPNPYFFRLTSGPNAPVTASMIDSSNRLLIGGDFTAINSIKSPKIARYNADGTLDTVFSSNIGSGFNNKVTRIRLQSDGKILVSGLFSKFNNVTANGFTRLNSDGTKDSTFVNSGYGAGNVTEMVAQPDGKIILVGNIFGSNSTGSIRGIIRLLNNGSNDLNFNIGTGGDLWGSSVKLRSDGKIFISGPFSTWNGTASPGFVVLNSDGSQDTAFTSNANFANAQFLIQPDNKVIVFTNVGTTTYLGSSIKGIMRLNADGTLDTSFIANIGNGFIGAQTFKPDNIFLQSDGKILFFGAFTQYAGLTKYNLLRLNSNGTLDSSFTQRTSPFFFINSAISTPNTYNDNSATIQSTIIQLPNGKIMLGGTWDAFGTSTNYLPYMIYLLPNGDIAI